MIPWTQIVCKHKEVQHAEVSHYQDRQQSEFTGLIYSTLGDSRVDDLYLAPSLGTFHYQVWGLEAVAGEVWKLLLTHCPCLRPGGGAASEAWTSLELPCSWKQRFRPSLLNCQFEACHGVSLAFSNLFWHW